MSTSGPRGESGSFARGADKLPAAAGRAARDRERLRASEAAMTSEVIEFQLARQRVGLRPVEGIEPLSPREREVLALLAAGRADGEIADVLFISKKTASVHVANIKGKLGASSRIEIAMLAARLGLVDENGRSSTAGSAPARSNRSRVICPFKGLASYDVGDARFFFGRERAVAELVARLAGSTFVGVVGASGSGKSSIVRAGLVPAIADGVLPGSERWAIALMRPGARPLAELLRVLTRAIRRGTVERHAGLAVDELLDALPTGGRVLLVVDQFEEVFTLCHDEVERASFIRAITSLARDPARRGPVVVTVRADFYGLCTEERDLAGLFGAGQVVVGPLMADELARAIELPARAAGLRVEPELTAALVADVAQQPGALPLLSTTLIELWQRRDGRMMRYATYERIGRVSGSVSRLAEAAMEQLGPGGLVAARAIFLRLATRGDGDTIVRRPVPVSEFDADRSPDVARALGVLTDHRLVTVDDGTVEVAHEVLLHEWPRLRDWLDEDAEGRRLRIHLTGAAREWADADEDSADLYRGARLGATLDWAEAHGPELNALERRFLAESRAAAEREVKRQQTVNQRLRGLLAGTAALLVVVAVAGGFAALQQARAEEEAGRAGQAAARAASESERARAAEARAENEARLARAGELTASSISVLDDDPSLAKLLALSAAASIDDPPVDLLGTLHQAWAEDRVVYRRAWPEDRVAEIWADIHPTGELALVTGGIFSPRRPGYLEVFDPASDDIAWTFEAGSGASLGFAFFAPAGRVVVAGVYRTGDDVDADDLGIYRWNALTGEVVRHDAIERCGAMVTAVSATHALVRTSASTPCFNLEQPVGLELLDLTTGDRIPLATNAPLYPERGALAAGGRYVAYDEFGETGSTSIVLDLVTGRRVLELDPDAVEGQEDRYVRAISDDGRRLLYGDRPLQLRDTASGRVLSSFGGPSGALYQATFSADGRLVYAVGRDARLRVWDAALGTERLVVPGVGSGRLSVTADGRVLVSRVEEATVAIVQTGTRGEVGGIDVRAADSSPVPGDGGGACFVTAGSLLVDGRHALFNDACGGPIEDVTTHVVNLERMQVLRSLPGGFGLIMATSPDGTRFVRSEGAGVSVRAPVIRDVATGAEVLTLGGTCEYENSFESAVGRGDCVAFPDGPFPLWPWQLAWSPDGSMIAGVDQGNGHYVAVWNARTGALLTDRRLEDGRDAYGAMFSPDSGRLVVTYVGGFVGAYETDGWRRIASADLAPASFLTPVGFSPDGSVLHVVSGFAGPAGGGLHWLDGETLRPTRAPRERIHEGSVKSVALSQDASLIATGSSDGLARVWDARSGDLVHEIVVRDAEVQGLAFVDRTRLAITRRDDGALRVYTLDGDELVRLTRASLTRTFTEVECARYGIDPCPTLEELRRG